MSHPARSTDIATSHEAAAELVRTGAQAAQQERTAALVRLLPGHTSGELAHNARCDRYMLARRLPELLAQGRVRRGPVRRCGWSGRQACTWWIVDSAPSSPEA